MTRDTEPPAGPLIVPGPIAFSRTPVAAGQERDCRRVLAITARTRTQPIGVTQDERALGQDQRIEWHETALAVDAEGVVTSVHVEYGMVRKTVHGADGPGPQRLAAATNQRYLVTRNPAGEIVVVGAGGAAAPPDEAARVRRDVHGLGQAPLFHRFAGSSEVTPGEALPVTRGNARHFFGLSEDFDVTDVSVVYRGAGKVVGRLAGWFDVRLNVQGSPRPGMQITAALDGLVAVDAATSERLSAALVGPLRLRGRKALIVNVIGVGTMEVSDTFTPWT